MTRTTPRTVRVLLAAAVLLSVTGLALLWYRLGPPGLTVVDGPPAEFGWFAYASPADGGEPRLVVLTVRDLWATAALVLGLTCGAVAVGYLAGRRRAVVPIPPPTD